MILDLHSHTKEHSACSQQTAEELILRAIEAGLDGIVITDHDYVWGREELDSVLDRLGDRAIVVLRGQEVSCPDGHLLVYGIEGKLPGEMSRADLAHWVRERDGATILAHPFRWAGFADTPDHEVGRYFRHFEGVEAWTTNHSETEQERGRRFQHQDRISLVGASDAHSPERVGRFATRFPSAIRDERELARALRAGKGVPIRLDQDQHYLACF